MKKIEKIKNLNGICLKRKTGLYKQWLYKDNTYMKMCNYMQKINFSIQDLNKDIEMFEEFVYKDIVFVISLVDWIREAVNKIISLIPVKVLENFVFSHEECLQERKHYLRAIRSFVVGHPLGTTEHKKFGFDGNFICVDIRNKKESLSLVNEDKYYTLKYNGLQKNKDELDDFYMYCYSDKDDGMKYFKLIGCQIKDIYDVAKLYIEKIYELDKYLSTKKKKDFGEIDEQD